tara:strand:- start:3 stop:554 length:552 start_codon:yes stop_codon:yes gene_type:complete
MTNFYNTKCDEAVNECESWIEDSHKQGTMTNFYNTKCVEAVNECESWIEDREKYKIIYWILKHPAWNLKWGSGKEFKLEKKDKDYRKYLLKVTNEVVSRSSMDQFEKNIDLIFNKKLIKEGGDPLVQEKYGGLSLGFIFCKIKNSGLQHKYVKEVPPLYFGSPDYGRNISNMLIRVYRVINNC